METKLFHRIKPNMSKLSHHRTSQLFQCSNLLVLVHVNVKGILEDLL